MYATSTIQCPVCKDTDSFYEGETCDVGFGDGPSGVKIGPDHCERCGYVEQGPDPTDPPISYFILCWNAGIDPRRKPVMKHGHVDPKYTEWIAANVVVDCLGRCRTYSRLMVETFPELRRVYGNYYCPIWGSRCHFWCIDADDNVIDPTASQFPSKGHGFYEMDRLYPIEPELRGITYNWGQLPNADL